VQNIRLLLIDDDEEEFLLTRDLLSDIAHVNYEVSWVDNAVDGMKGIMQNKFDAFLVDYYLGAETGIDLIKKAVKITSKPLILLTGRIDIAIDEEAKASGAADYIEKGQTKPFLMDRVIRYSIERAKNVEEILQLNQSLEIRVQERTLELDKAIKLLEEKNQNLIEADKKIRQALKREKELNEMKSRFVSMASHEFRTPLATILSSASLVSKYTSTEQQPQRDKHIQRIMNNVDHLNSILLDFLSIGKLEEGAVGYVPTHFDFHAFVHQVLDDLSLTKKNGQKFEITFEEEHRTVNYDSKVLKNILINLLSNAIKYSPENSLIKVHTVYGTKVFSISITDQGIGISEEEKLHIFDRFFRANNAANIPGTGLGLNIVKKYLELMNGDIDFSSEVGKGSTFKILLPANYRKG
jgi:signal transduction histidine kinase